MSDNRALTRLVIIDGAVWEAGSVPPPEVAERIRNPICWKPVEPEPNPWGPEGYQRADGTDSTAVPAADQAPNGINNREPVQGDASVVVPSTGTVIGQPEPVTEPESEPTPEPEPQTETEQEPAVEPELHDSIEVGDDEPVLLSQEPPRSGAGSGVGAWRQFAADRQVDVPADASRDEIIDACRQAGVIQ